MVYWFSRAPWLVGGLALAIALSLPTVSLSQADTPAALDAELSAAERTALGKGNIIVSAEEGQFHGWVLVKAKPGLVWEVLTDYANFKDFIPNVVSSEILENNGTQKVIEQVSVRQVFVVSVRSRIRSALTETPQQRIEFEMVEGDLKSLKGSWQMEANEAGSSESAVPVLITYTAQAQPLDSPFADSFPQVYRKALEDTLSGIRKEIQRRAE